MVYEDVYSTVTDAIREWCDRIGVEQGGWTQNEMLDFIEEYEYENTYFIINIFEFE